MQEVIDKLKTLQDILSERYKLEQELKDIPRSLSTKNELLSRLKKQYIEKNEQFEAAKNRIRDLKTKMDEAERDREHYEQQMSEIKTQREYEALDKEIREAGEREQYLRKELQREERELEETKHGLEREEQMISEQEKELQEEQSRIESESESKKKQIADLQKEQDKISPGMDEDLLFKFDRIIRSKEGEGIVPLRKGVCTGCNMILPKQFVNEVRLGQEIKFCPYCSKVVFYANEDLEPSDEDSEGLMDVFDDDTSGGLADLMGEGEDEERLLEDEDPPMVVQTDEDEDDTVGADEAAEDEVVEDQADEQGHIDESDEEESNVSEEQ